MRLILAHAWDVSARALARRWGSGVLCLTPAELSRHGWRLEIDRAGVARAGLGPEVLIDGVLTRLAGVSAGELRHVHPDDREYAATELTAFLLGWLDAVPCPVLNRPGAGSLNGPAWAPEHWARAAAKVGLQVRPVRRRVDLTQPVAEPASDSARVTVVRDTCFGPVDPLIAKRLCDLADDAGTPLIGAVLDSSDSDAVVLAITAWPDLTDPDVAAAVGQVLGATSC